MILMTGGAYDISLGRALISASLNLVCPINEHFFNNLF